MSKRGSKKFTVSYEGHFLSGARIFGQVIVFAPDEDSAKNKVRERFDKRKDEPSLNVRDAHKWQYGEQNDSDIDYPYSPY